MGKEGEDRGEKSPHGRWGRGAKTWGIKVHMVYDGILGNGGLGRGLQKAFIFRRSGA